MRHRVKGRKLNRTASHRLATFRALATALVREKKIRTTVAKAKSLRGFVEPIISRAKTDSVANRRNIARHIQDKEVLKELFNEIIPTIGDRPGGYTRVIKLGQRPGDGAEMAIIELVDYNNVNKTETPKAAKPAKDDVIEDANVVEETVTEKVAEDIPEAENSEEIKTDDVEKCSKVKGEEVETKVDKATEKPKSDDIENK